MPTSIEIISCEEVKEEEFESLKSNPRESLKDLLSCYGAPAQKADSSERFLARIIKDHAEWMLGMLDDYDGDLDGYEEEMGERSIVEDLANLAREVGTISTVYTRITYPLHRPALFRFTLNLNGKTLTVGHLLWVYTRAYQMVYALEEEEDGDPGYIAGMFNRATSNGPFQIWGHVIEDLVYNGGSKIDVYDDYVICEFDCDS